MFRKTIIFSFGLFVVKHQFVPVFVKINSKLIILSVVLTGLKMVVGILIPMAEGHGLISYSHFVASSPARGYFSNLKIQF